MNIVAQRPEIYYNGTKLPKYDAVIPRIGASVTFYGLAILCQFEMMGVYSLNESMAIGRSRDKLRSLQILSREGTQGIGVVLARHRPFGQVGVEAFRSAKMNVLVQEFIKELGGTNIRALAVGCKVVAAMGRKGAEGDFRSNLYLGGNAETIKISPEERAKARRAAKAMGLNVCCVDMLRSNHGPVVMEVNSSPGLEGVGKATGINVTGRIINLLEKEAKPGKTRTKGRG